jgi:hypothetical protein
LLASLVDNDKAPNNDGAGGEVVGVFCDAKIEGLVVAVVGVVDAKVDVT